MHLTIGPLSARLTAVVLSMTVISCAGDIPHRPINEADGVYENRCCLPLVLKSGTLRIGKRYVSYVIEQDKRGRYILPSQSIDIEPDGRISVGNQKFPLKIYLGDGSPPPTMEIMSGTRVDTFDRKR